MSKLSIDDVMATIIRLPALRPVVLHVLASFEEPDIDVDRIVAELANDQTLAARVLRLANSSFYGLQTRIATLNEAVMILGFRHIRATVAAVAVTECFTERLLPGFDFSAFWKHSAAVGLGSRILASSLGRHGEVAFLGGLLHDIGTLVLLSLFPEPYARVTDLARRERCLIIDAEHEIIGIDHALVGEALARSWKFPTSIREAIGGHHAPDDLTAESPAGVIHIADAIVHAMGISHPIEELVPPLSSVAFNRLGLHMEDLQRIMREIDCRVDEITHALNG